MTDRAYRAAPADALRIEPLGELTAIFDRRSMQTHLVAAPMSEILHALAAGPGDAAALAARLASEFDFAAVGDPAALIAERLAELAVLGLAERA